MSWWHRLLGREELPEGFTGTLDREERVLGAAAVRGGGVVVATSLGLWLLDGRRVDWHLVSKATWSGEALELIEAAEVGTLGPAVLLADRPPVRLVLVEPGRVPEAVHRRVTGSIRARHRVELPGGGAWFLRRGVPGRDGALVQVRADPGTDEAALRAAADQAVETVRGLAG